MATPQTRKDNGVLPRCAKGPHKVQITAHAVEMSVTYGRQVFISYVKVKYSSGYLNLLITTRVYLCIVQTLPILSGMNCMKAAITVWPYIHEWTLSSTRYREE